ncbi:HNH endonuclease [Streptomyces sp. MNP-20]|uniref:HNH endonuclease n=1 Tax=Streptomyces sp. MNP-20 TaxID=2721165 RepID=UPI001552E503|nr:HNH endonuclease signature motif containing protein [Streptomyces sp. MNP-20]
MAAEEEVPDWRSPSLGLLKRVAAYLATEVGEGGTFDKEAFVEAFSDDQVLRRLRDLRKYGWEIDSPRSSDSWRLVKIGAQVWSPRALLVQRRISRSAMARLRQEVLARDLHCCRSCGVGAGEQHLDAPYRTARLGVFHRSGLAQGGADSVENMITLCDRCEPGGDSDSSLPSDSSLLDGARKEVLELPMRQRAALLSWMTVGERRRSATDRVWAAYRHMNDDDRNALRLAIAASFADEADESESV